MRMTNIRLISTVFVFLGLLFHAVPRDAIAAEYDSNVAQAELVKALERLNDCNKGCAIELRSMIFDGVAKATLGHFGAMKTQESKASKKIKVLTWYVFIQFLYETGVDTLEANKACYESCDKLSQDIIRLGRAGLLGPMIRGQSVDYDALANGEVFKSYLKFIKPIELPAEHRSKDWWKAISSTG